MKKQFNREVHISTFARNKYCAELREDNIVIFRVIFNSITAYYSMISDWQYGKHWGYFLPHFFHSAKHAPNDFRFTFNASLPKEEV